MKRSPRWRAVALAALCLALVAVRTGDALGQLSYVPGTKLIILRAEPPLPDRPAVEKALAAFARDHRFSTTPPMGRSSVIYGRDPSLSLVGTFAPRYVNVVLWTDPDDRASHGEDVADLAALLQPLGFSQVPELPVDPD